MRFKDVGNADYLAESGDAAIYRHRGSLALAARSHQGEVRFIADDRLENDVLVEDLEAAQGKVVCSGLGVGAMLKVLNGNPKVSEVLIIEISQDVIDLVSPYLDLHKITILCTDVNTWEPSGAWDLGYWDHYILGDEAERESTRLLKTRLAPWIGRQVSTLA